MFSQIIVLSNNRSQALLGVLVNDSKVDNRNNEIDHYLPMHKNYKPARIQG